MYIDHEDNEASALEKQSNVRVIYRKERLTNCSILSSIKEEQNHTFRCEKAEQYYCEVSLNDPPGCQNHKKILPKRKVHCCP